MKATTRRGGAMGTLPAKKRRKKKAPARGFMCGCGGTKSVSVNISTVTMTPTKKGTSAAASPGEPASPAKTTAACCDADADEASAEGTPSVDSLLWQLRELERGVRELGVREREEEEDGDGGSGSGSGSGPGTTTRPPPPPRHHTRSSTVVRRLDSECVAVVTESADPLGDFRRSMAQMIVENRITGVAELRELLRRFLALNAACHHHLILRAFADVWEELFAAAAAASSSSSGHAHADAAPPPGARHGDGLARTAPAARANVHAVALTDTLS